MRISTRKFIFYNVHKCNCRRCDADLRHMLVYSKASRKRHLYCLSCAFLTKIADVSDFISCQKAVERLTKNKGLITILPQKEGKLLVPINSNLDPTKIKEHEENVMAFEKRSRGRCSEI